MRIIINELSLHGQFNSVSTFAKSIEKSLQILDILNDLEVSILKKSDFYNLLTLPGKNLHDVVVENSNNDTIRALQSNVVNWCIKAPYWDTSPVHTCDDSYKSTFTADLCNYGLAEAVENDKIVFSFDNASFSSHQLEIRKNKKLYHLYNLIKFVEFRDHLLTFLNNNLLTGIAINDFFPKRNVAEKILRYSEYKNILKGLSESQKRNLYKEFGELIARINGWVYSSKLSGKNKRDTYIKHFGGNHYNLEVDTRHGTFEMYQNGNHLGEYKFSGDEHSDAIPGRTTSYK